jgi:hypothetical protein
VDAQMKPGYIVGIACAIGLMVGALLGIRMELHDILQVLKQIASK